ncbi:primosomal protein N' [Barnesiella viscericola]|uniref:replication restart helicase PriA n=1 Tax=Barnesiella viscericola TaxID=397865 RepID=UPI0025A39020|nr:primosomal protein N' [Barnesiella viscericola]MDM8267532.1 primosomal protein N' [Barnesiella viscericola]
MNTFADVVLPLPLYKYFTYRIPSDWQAVLQPGSRVVVPFGRKKYYTAIVTRLHDVMPQGYEVKEILSILDDRPVLRRPQLQFWEWIADYYLCSVGDVYKAALPSGLKLESETVVTLNTEFEELDDDRLKEREWMLLAALGKKSRMTVQELEKESGMHNVLPTLRLLLEREAVFVSEQIKAHYRPKTEAYIRLTFAPGDEAALRSAFERVKQAKKQEVMLLSFLDLSLFMQKGKLREVSRKALLDRSGVSSAVLGAMVEKGIFEVYKKEISRFDTATFTEGEIAPLSELQQTACNQIGESFREHAVTLLHGVTSSGKTEIYAHLIQRVLAEGRQVLYLVPEIALTTQLTNRLRKMFGDKLMIYHSKFSDNERVEIWNTLLDSREPRLVLGVRSSIFLPFADLGLVIVDEEHETSYKQYDPAPRYHARNAAIVLASMHGAKTLLGTATPAIETYFNARQGKYGLVELKKRFNDVELPEIIPVDVKEMRKKNRMQGNFTPELLNRMQHALQAGEQVILFQNRRGFAPMVECKQCAWVPKCEHCDVSLTYHKRYNQLTCHYCGYTYEIPKVCPACGQPTIGVMGFGTERIEEDVARLFPEVPVSRMDLDTTRSRNAYEQIIDDFSKGKNKILIGTQMITKGLDFDRVSVVGILSADQMMNFPDFRAHERAFQMMEQVSGRAGRKNKKGVVVLQTSDPSSPLIQQVIAHDYEGMYNRQLAERKAFSYPPYTRLIYIYLKHRDETLLQELAVRYTTALREVFGSRVLGPDNPPVARIQSLYIRKVVLKMELAASMSRVKEILRQVYENMLVDDRFKSLLLYYDVDPL